MPAHAQQPHHLSCCRALTRTALSWSVTKLPHSKSQELCEMSCVSCEMSCVKELGWSSVREHEAAPPNATRKQLLRELSCVRWVEWDELCEMSCVTCEMRGVVWDEMCALCETTWVKLREKEATQEEKEEKARNTNIKTKAPHRDVRKKT